MTAVHTYQQNPTPKVAPRINDPFGKNDILPGNFLEAMAAAATGVNIITTDGDAGRFGLTVSAVSSVSAEPPMILACVNRRSPLCPAVRNNGVFAINMLTTHHRQLANVFAGRPQYGSPYDFNATYWHQGSTGVPLLKDALCVFDCSLDSAYDCATHTIFIGRVRSAINGTGSPLLYSNRDYGFVSRWERR